MKISISGEHLHIRLTIEEARLLREEIGDLPRKLLTTFSSRKLIQIYKAIDPILNLKQTTIDR